MERRLALAVSPQLVLDINTTTLPSDPSDIVAVGSTAYFLADDGVHGRELWKSDGTAAGTTLVKDIRPGVDSSQMIYLTNLGGTLYFSADDGTSGRELWKSDGTAAGTVRVRDIRSNGGSDPQQLTVVGGLVMFLAWTDAGGQELWRSDGTAAGSEVAAITAMLDTRPALHIVLLAEQTEALA